jgi:transcriptional regulator with XRE-family HTH domain
MATDDETIINLTDPALKFGDRLRVLRRHLDFDQKQMAEALGVTPSALGNWETHRGNPRYNDIVRMAQLVEERRYCSADWLLGLKTGSMWRDLTSNDGSPALFVALPKTELAFLQ